MTQSPTGGPAQTTYQVTSRAGVVGHDAQRVVIVTDGRPAEGGPQQAVYFVSDAEIAAGDFIVTGNKPLPIVQVGAAGVEYPPIAVYDVTGKPDDVQPSQNPVVPPVAPQFSAAEVGAVNASTVAVTFDQSVSATGNDYSSGVTIKVNGSTRNFESGIRQANHALVYYALATPAQGGDAVTWEYSAAAGSIVSESDGTALADVTAQSVTNNIPDPIGDGLRANVIACWTMNQSSGARADSADALNLTDNGSVGSAIGIAGNAASFDGTQGKFLSHTFAVDPQMCGGDFTVAFWLYINAYPVSSSGTLVQKADDSDLEFYTDLSFQGRLDFGIVDGDFSYPNLTTPQSPGQISIGAWHFIIAEQDTALLQMRMRIDNGVPRSLSISGGNPTTTAAIRIGCNSSTDTSFNGLIDEVGIWKRLLSADEIAYLYNSGAGRALFP